MLLILALSFLTASVQAQDILVTSDRSCADSRSTLGAAVDILDDDNYDSWYWVGLYRNEDITPDRVRRGEAFLRGEPELWVS
jgi:hypothetical protein